MTISIFQNWDSPHAGLNSHYKAQSYKIKSHKCEEGGSHLFLAFTDELEKQISIKKLLKWTNKKTK